MKGLRGRVLADAHDCWRLSTLSSALSSWHPVQFGLCPLGQSRWPTRPTLPAAGGKLLDTPRRQPVQWSGAGCSTSPPVCPVTRKSARRQSLRPVCYFCQLNRPGSGNRSAVTCGFVGYLPDWAGLERLAMLGPVPARANFDGTPPRDSMPVKKARAGQRRISGPRYLSPDSALRILGRAN
jgi:hypothetical protein